MDPKRTREALTYWEGWQFGDYPLPDLGALDSILDFAREAIDLFVECEECYGTGEGGFDRNSSHAEGRYVAEPCRACGGRGFSLNRERVIAAVLAHTKAEGFISPADDAFVSMRAAIAAFLFGDSTETRQEEQ